MTPITWRRVRAGEYEGEAGRIVLTGGYTGPGWLTRFPDARYDAFGTLRDAKAACEAAWRRAQEGRD